MDWFPYIIYYTIRMLIPIYLMTIYISLIESFLLHRVELQPNFPAIIQGHLG